MYIFRKEEFISTSVECKDFDEIVDTSFLSDDYDFVVFTEASRDFPLIMKADPKRMRVIYKNRRSPFIQCAGIRTSFQAPDENTLDCMEKNPNPLLYLSPVRTWFWRKREWFDYDVDIQKRLDTCSELAKYKTFLYFDYRQCPTEFVPKGFKVICPELNPCVKNIFQMMVDNNAFAILSTDDIMIGQPRDWEIAQALVPGFKVTKSGRAPMMSNPCRNYFVSTIKEAEKFAHEFSKNVNGIGEMLKAAQDFSFLFTINERFFDACDALLCDFELLRTFVPRGVSCINEIVNVAKGR